MSDSQTVSASYLQGCSEDLGKGFWQQWQQYQDYLHRCCIKWMGGNPTDAEDALSRAMLKAWEKVQKYAAGEITNFKAWLTTLTRNLCVDIYRERSRGANRVEDIEGYASNEEQGLLRSEDTPEIALETGEKRMVIRRAIDNLPPRLRETFILHFYQELSYPEIAQQQEISYQNVCKRISQTRAILREELRGYFIGEEATDRDKFVPPTATESAIGEMSQGNAPVEAIAEETVTLLEEVQTVGEVQEVAPDVQHSESVMGATSSDGKLEEFLSGGAVEATTQQLFVGKVGGEWVLVRSSRSPPWDCFPCFQFFAKSLSGMMRESFLDVKLLSRGHRDKGNRF
ncbi:sigma-70 family RNA polymerase sigma factor [Microcoleus sp. D3_18_C4]|uniref:sigma-70 family RNA polymerase sigma factor n=1 Tax=Microcoleus sp. D3_18_C4 TaxID=3055335 RepID=UPI002FD43843